MKQPTLSEFFILQKSIIDFYLHKSGLADKDIKRKKKYNLFGFDAGKHNKDSINYIICEALPYKKNINGKKLYDAIKQYNIKAEHKSPDEIRRSLETIVLPHAIYKAYLLIKEIKDLMEKNKNVTIQNKIDYTGTSRKIKTEKNQNKMSANNRTFTTLNKRLSGTKWFLYSYNPHRNGIVQAVINVGELKSNSTKAEAKLINPPCELGFFNHIGKMNFKYADHRLLIFDFEPEGIDEKQLHMKFKVNFQNSLDYVFVGHLMNFQRKRVESYNVVLQSTQSNINNGIFHDIRQLKVNS